jgi:hypothetical protein
VVDAEPVALSEVLWHGRPLADAERAGAIRLEGSRAAVRRFLKLFPPPAPVAA